MFGQSIIWTCTQPELGHDELMVYYCGFFMFGYAFPTWLYIWMLMRSFAIKLQVVVVTLNIVRIPHRATGLIYADFKSTSISSPIISELWFGFSVRPTLNDFKICDPGQRRSTCCAICFEPLSKTQGKEIFKLCIHICV